jgi:DNA-binding NarL/FixJ family response regulator
VKRVRVLVANHPRLMRELVMATIADQPDIEVVGEVQNESDLADIVEQVQPDVLIIATVNCRTIHFHASGLPKARSSRKLSSASSVSQGGNANRFSRKWWMKEDTNGRRPCRSTWLNFLPNDQPHGFPLLPARDVG